MGDIDYMGDMGDKGDIIDIGDIDDIGDIYDMGDIYIGDTGAIRDMGVMGWRGPVEEVITFLEYILSPILVCERPGLPVRGPASL